MSSLDEPSMEVEAEMLTGSASRVNGTSNSEGDPRLGPDALYSPSCSFFFFLFKYLFIWLYQVLVAACGI